MKKIKLSQNKVVLVDDEDFKRVKAFKWHFSWSGWRGYAKTNILLYGNKRTSIYLHRFLLNAQKGMQTDHINGNTMDNRKENLRLCTKQQNAFNKKSAHKNNKLGIKGVHWDKNSKRFRAQIMVNGKNFNLGSFEVLSDADTSYRKAEKKYFGNFARN